ncbi:TPA: hypothetical protein TZE22_000320 [Streptococcus suis]|nr:hypothetical protein [Streptococcus suis]
MGIDNHLKVIKEGVFGRDVRQAIHDGIQQAYDDATANGNANMEVAKARATFETLAGRLASMSDKLDDKANAAWVESQLQNILSSSPKSSLASLAEIQSTYPTGANGIVVARDTGKWYYWTETSRAWSEGGVYQSRSLGGNEVTADNIDFVQGIQQMLTQQIAGSTWVWNSGIKTYSSADWARYMPINLIKGKTYYIYNARGYFSHIVSIDGKRHLRQLSTIDTLITLEYTATEDSLLYISTNTSKSDNAPKVFNASINELKTAKVDLMNLPDGYVTVSIPKLSLDVKPDDLSFANIYKQLLDEDALKRGVYYVGNKTATSDSATWGVYPMIYLKAGKKYGLKNVRGVFTYFFSNSDKLIKKFATTDVLIDEDFIPQEDGYLLVTRRLEDAPSKVIQGGLDKVSLLPNLNYMSSVIETNMPLISPRAKTDFNVKKDGTGDFTSIYQALKSVGHGTADSPINIYIYGGVYDILAELGGRVWLNETVESTNSERLGLEVPDYVNLIGVGDVTLSLEVRDEDTTENTAKRISALNLWRHNTIKNIKIIVQNTRYAVHDETNNAYHNNDVRYIDCYFEHKGNKRGVWSSTQAYAAGMGSGGNYYFENCTFKSVAIPFSMHDNFNVESNRVRIVKCTFITGNDDVAIRFGSYGTGAKKSIVTIENCNIDKCIKLFEEHGNSRHGNHFAVSGGGNTIVPYININSAGRKERVEFADEVRILKNTGQAKITIGTPVKLVGNTVQPLVAEEPYLFYGVALDDIEPNATGLIKYAGYIAKEDTGISSFSAGQRIGLVNGRLSPVDTADFIAYAVDASNILLK